jgi:hypothetical protein
MQLRSANFATAGAQSKCNTHQGVDHFLRTEYRVDTYHVQNLEYLDQFNDIDDEYEGMTIVEPLNTLDAIQFLNGYNL